MSDYCQILNTTTTLGGAKVREEACKQCIHGYNAINGVKEGGQEGKDGKQNITKMLVMKNLSFE